MKTERLEVTRGSGNVYRDLGSSLGRKTENREIGSWFAAVAAVLLLGAVGLSRLWSAPLP